MSLKISLLFHTATFTHMSQTKQETMSKHKMSEKSQKKLLISKIDEKSVDKNDLSPALRSETTSRRAWGVFCRKDFCMNLLTHNSFCDFCINSAFTKFHLVLFCFYLPILIHRDKVYIWEFSILVKNFLCWFVYW